LPSQAVPLLELLLLKKPRRKRRKKKRKPTSEVVWICSVEVVVAETTKNSSDNLHRPWGFDNIYSDFLPFVCSHFLHQSKFFSLVFVLVLDYLVRECMYVEVY
jgi:hypothetical protein